MEERARKTGLSGLPARGSRGGVRWPDKTVGGLRCAPYGSCSKGKKSGVVTIDASEPVRTAIQLMATTDDIGALPVGSRGGKLDRASFSGSATTRAEGAC
jgi:hypothetical protein